MIDVFVEMVRIWEWNDNCVVWMELIWMEVVWLCNNFKGIGFCFIVVDCDWLSRVVRIRVLDCVFIIELIYYVYVVELMFDRLKVWDDEVGRFERFKIFFLLIVVMIMGKDVVLWRFLRRFNWVCKLFKWFRFEFIIFGLLRKGLFRGGVC